LNVFDVIDSIQTENENIKVSDVERSELKDFVDSMSSAQYAKITNFISEMPSLKHRVNFKCSSCETDNDIVLEGINDFF
jgi:T4 bacteriophage base plate protein.